MGGFSLLERDHEVRIFTGYFLAMIIARESHLESLAFACLHSQSSVFKLFEHLAIADDELKIIGLATGEYFTVNLAFKIDHHPITVMRWRIVRTLGKSAALLAQNVERFVDRTVSDISRYFFNLSRTQVSYPDFRINLKYGVKRHFAFRRCFLFGDTGLPCYPQFGIIGGSGKGFANFVVHDFVVHRIAITLRNHVHRHFAGAKTIHLDRAGELLQARLNFRLDGADGQSQRHFSLQFVQGFNRNGHKYSPKCLNSHQSRAAGLSLGNYIRSDKLWQLGILSQRPHDESAEVRALSAGFTWPANGFQAAPFAGNTPWTKSSARRKTRSTKCPKDGFE